MGMSINPGDMAWLTTASALVMLMTPALGFFYGGARQKKEHCLHDSAMLCHICCRELSIARAGLSLN
jgi:ammonia channel protein AmtB